MNLILVLFGSFFGLCLIGVPVAVSLSVSALVTGLMTHGKGGGKRRVHGAVMFVNLKKAMCRQAACSGQEHRLPAARRG